MFKNLFKAVAIITLFSIATRVLSFLLKIYLSRSIGAEQMGVLQVGISLFGVFAALVASGLPLAVSKFTSNYKTLDKQKQQYSCVTAGLIISLITSIIIVVFVFIFKNSLNALFTNEESLTTFLILLPAFVCTALQSAFKGSLWGEKLHAENCTIDFIEQFLRLILSIIIIMCSLNGGNGAKLTATALSISCFVSLICAFIFYLKKGGKFANPKLEFKPLLKSSVPITIVRFLSSLVQPLIAIVIPARLISAGFTNAQAMEMLGAGIGMALPLLFIPSTLIGSLSTALVPDLSGLITEQKHTEVNLKIKSSLMFSMFISCLLIPFYLGAGEPIGMFLFNNATSGIYIYNGAWLMIPIGLCGISTSILNSLGLEIKSAKNYVFGAITLLLSIWFLPQYVGMNAVIIGMGLCLSIASILNCRMIFKATQIRGFNLKESALLCALIIPATLLCRWTYNICSLIFTQFFSLAICGIISVVSYVLLCIIFKLVDFSAIKVKIDLIKKRKLIKAKKLN